MRLIRILVVDDNRLFLETLCRFLLRPTYTVIARATGGLEALAQIDSLRPDLVLMDIAMPGMLNGLETTRRIKAQPNPPRVLILTLHNESAYIAEANKAGADGLIAKSDMMKLLLPAINELFVTGPPFT